MQGSNQELIAEQIEYYSRRAPEYDATSRPPEDPLADHGRQITEALHRFRPVGSVLEIACGTGAWTVELTRYATGVTALDASAEMLDLNRQKVNDPRVRYLRADIFQWQPDRSYDVVMFANWLSHVPPTRFDDFWLLVDRCLRRRGRVFFTDEVVDAWRKEKALTEQVVQHPEVPLVRRTLGDGTDYRVIKVFWDPRDLESRLPAMGWDITVRSTGVFYWGEGTRSAFGG